MTNKKILGAFTLAMMSVASIINLRGLPLMASEGLSSIFFYLLAAIFFLIPSGLVCAELASSFPQAGGIYLWVRQAFGDKTGFLAIWLEWINNVISFPASLSFMAATLAYIFDPNFAQHKLYIFVCTLLFLWGTTLFNLLGIKASGRLNIIGALLGTLIPGAIIILLGSYWLFAHKASQISFTLTNLFPAWHLGNFAFFAGVLSGYSGMQITAFHAPNVKDPQRDYIKAIFTAVILILLTTMLASLAIAVVVPHTQLSLVSGLMEGFNNFFYAFNIHWATPILAGLILIGAFSTLSAWLMGPARGLATAAKNGHFPRLFALENVGGSPANVLILQAVIASVLASLFLYMPDASAAFWILLALSSQSTLLMYILVFAAAIRLRYSAADTIRPFKIPGGNLGVWITASAAIIVCSMAVAVSFVPPNTLKTGNIWHYEAFLIGSNIIYVFIPIIVISLAIRKNKTPINNLETKLPQL